MAAAAAPDSWQLAGDVQLSSSVQGKAAMIEAVMAVGVANILWVVEQVADDESAPTQIRS